MIAGKINHRTLTLNNMNEQNIKKIFFQVLGIIYVCAYMMKKHTNDIIMIHVPNIN